MDDVCRVSREDIPISCRGVTRCPQKPVFCRFTYKPKKMIQNNEINENNIFKGQRLFYLIQIKKLKKNFYQIFNLIKIFKYM